MDHAKLYTTFEGCGSSMEAVCSRNKSWKTEKLCRTSGRERTYQSGGWVRKFPLFPPCCKFFGGKLTRCAMFPSMTVIETFSIVFSPKKGLEYMLAWIPLLLRYILAICSLLWFWPGLMFGDYRLSFW